MKSTATSGLFFLSLLSLASTWPSASAKEPANPAPPSGLFDQKGTAAAFVGDSLTEGGGYHYRMQAFLSTRYPGRDLWLINFGWNGEVAHRTLDMLPLNQPPEEANVVFVHFGINDVNRDVYKEQTIPPDDEARGGVRDRFESSLGKLLDALAREGRTLVVISPTIYDDTSTAVSETGVRPHLNAELVRFGEIGKAVAENKGVTWIDVHTLMQEVTEREQAKNPAFTLTSGDGVHHNSLGSDVFFVALLKGLRQEGSVYDVSLHADGKVVSTKGATLIDANRTSEGGLKFVLEETALPYAGIDPASGLELVGFTESFNQMRLAIGGLPTGHYRIQIDGQEVAKTDADSLASGLELSTLPTPQKAEAEKISRLVSHQKLNAERALRTMAKIRVALQQEQTDEDIDWNSPDPELIEAVWRQRPPSAWNDSMLKSIQQDYPKWNAIHEKLASIRRELAAIPTTRKYTYEIVPEPAP
jgi:lysophospholipase L1-like esterase